MNAAFDILIVHLLQEMKGGISLRNIPLDARSFHSFGRLDSCHVVMAHPTISRYHAVLQFRSTFSSEDEKRGFYLYDLGSTHGTFLNKYRIVPKTYVKVQVRASIYIFLLKKRMGIQTTILSGWTYDQIR